MSLQLEAVKDNHVLAVEVHMAWSNLMLSRSSFPMEIVTTVESCWPTRRDDADVREYEVARELPET